MSADLLGLLLVIAAGSAVLLALAVTALHWLLPGPKNFGHFGDDVDE